MSLYHKLERVIVPMFYSDPDAYARVMRGAIAVNGSLLNTHRMVSQYVANAWFHETSSDIPDARIGHFAWANVGR